jgi:hypothetical protein
MTAVVKMLSSAAVGIMLATSVLAEKTNEFMEFKIKDNSIMIRRLLYACVPSLVLIVAYIATIDPAVAHTPYDGDWSVVIVAHSGACDSSYRFGVQVADGLVINDGGLATIQGWVTPRGLERVSVRAGSQWASGSGRLTGKRGGGVWRGQGMNGNCGSTWIAERCEYRRVGGEQIE